MNADEVRAMLEASTWYRVESRGERFLREARRIGLIVGLVALAVMGLLLAGLAVLWALGQLIPWAPTATVPHAIALVIVAGVAFVVVWLLGAVFF